MRSHCCNNLPRHTGREPYLAAMRCLLGLVMAKSKWRLAALLLGNFQQSDSRALGRRTAFVARECRQWGLTERPRWGTSRS